MPRTLKQAQRQAAADVASETGVPLPDPRLQCTGTRVIASWLAQRQADQNDPSDATLEVVATAQLSSRDPLTGEELLKAKRVETNESGNLDELVNRFASACPAFKTARA